MADKPVANPQRLKKWPTKPKQDKAAESGARHVPVGGEVAVPAPAVAEPIVEVQETGDERRARQATAVFGETASTDDLASI